MGLKIGKFFKKIGSGVKKLTKKINMKGFVKLAGNGLSMLPGVGGIVGQQILNAQDAHYQKKAEREALEQMEQNPEFSQMANTEKVMLVKNAISSGVVDSFNQAQDLAQRKGVTLGEVLTATAGGALQGAGSALAGDVKVIQTGGTFTQGVFMNWLKRFWYVPLGVVVVLALVWKKITGGTRRRR